MYTNFTKRGHDVNMQYTADKIHMATNRKIKLYYLLSK